MADRHHRNAQAEAKCDQVLDFRGKNAATMRDVRCRDRMEPSCREPGIQTHGGPDQEKPSGLAPRAALGVALVLARPAVTNWWISNREGSVSGGAIQIHPLIRLACDSWQRRDQQLSIRRGSVRSSVLVWNAAARSRIGATAGGYREATKFCQPSCQRKAAKNAGGLSGEGQAVLCVQTAKKRPFSLTQNQPPKTGKVAA